MKAAFFRTLKELAADPRLMFVKADTAYVPDFQAAFPAQYLDVGIAEQNMVGVAAGLALEGFVPFTYSIVDFASMRCLEQIRNDVAYHGLNVKIVACGQGFDYGSLGPTHHATEDLAIMRAMPNMTVYCPADPAEAEAVTRAAFASPGPCFIRLGHGGEPDLHGGPVDDFVTGRAYPLTPVDGAADAAIFAAGSIAGEALEAARRLRDMGIGAEVWSFPTVKPLDAELVRQKAEKCRLIVTLEEHNVIGGLGSAAAEVIAGMSGPRGALRRVGIPDTFAYEIGPRGHLISHYGLDAGAVVRAVLEGLEAGDRDA